jgi:hypothetical protein
MKNEQEQESITMRSELGRGVTDSSISWREMFESLSSEYQEYRLSNERLKDDIENRLASIQITTDMLSVPELSSRERLALRRLMQKAIAELKSLIQNLESTPSEASKPADYYLSELNFN